MGPTPLHDRVCPTAAIGDGASSGSGELISSPGDRVVCRKWSGSDHDGSREDDRHA
jgi:hypothetical protein